MISFYYYYFFKKKKKSSLQEVISKNSLKKNSSKKAKISPEGRFCRKKIKGRNLLLKGRFIKIIIIIIKGEILRDDFKKLILKKIKSFHVLLIFIIF